MELKLISRIVGSIPDRELTSKLWKGLSINLQCSLWRDSLDPEYSNWEEIVRAAERHEIANSLRIGSGELNRAGPVSRPRPDPFIRTANISRDTGGNPGPGTPPPALRKPYTAPRQTSSRPSGTRTMQSVGSHLTERQRAEHAASGKCFGCGETGHLYRNCPRLNSVKGSRNHPPGSSNFNIEVGAGNIDAHSTSAIPVGEVTMNDAEVVDYEEDFDSNNLDVEADEDEVGPIDGEDPDDSLELAALCLLYDPGMETDSEDNNAEGSEAPDPEGTGSEGVARKVRRRICHQNLALDPQSWRLQGPTPCNTSSMSPTHCRMLYECTTT